MNTDESADVRNDDGRKAASQFDRETKTSGVWDWTSRTISIIAIVISLVSAYVTVIRRTDALSVYMPDVLPIIYIEDESGQLGMAFFHQHWILINSGTGSIAIVEEGLSVSDGESECSQAFFFYDTPPIVIKSGDIAVQDLEKVQFEKSRWKPGKPMPSGSTLVLDGENGKRNVGDEVTVCIYFDIVTSANVTERKWLALFTTKLEKISNLKMWDALHNKKSDYEFSKTISIFYHFGTIFN